MKSVVFVELLNMAEQTFGENTVDKVLNSCPLSTDGSYTRVGVYPCSELLSIIDQLESKANAPAEQLQRQFGHWMMAYFAVLPNALQRAYRRIFDAGGHRQ